MPNIAKPRKLKELAGNPGKRKLNKREPIPSADPTPPTIMTEPARMVWMRLVLSMPPGVYTSLDSNLLAAYCEAVATHQVATQALIKQPHETIGSTGQPKLSDYFKLQADSARLMATLGARLGLDPIARQQLQTSEGQVDNEFGDLIN